MTEKKKALFVSFSLEKKKKKKKPSPFALKYTMRGNAISCEISCLFCRKKGRKNYLVWYKSALRIVKETYDMCGYSGKCTAYSDLYTLQKPEIPRYVDNMVDNVDKPLWISSTVFVHTSAFERILTRGKRLPFYRNLQEILPDFGANLCSVAGKKRFLSEFRRRGAE